MEKHVINLILGDTSGDGHGHGQTETETILSNLDPDQVREAYTLGANLVGVDITSLCEEYEDNRIPEEEAKLLQKAGLSIDLDDSIWTGVFIDIYLFLVKKGNESFEYEKIDNNSNIEIGGYGLFY